MTNNLQVWHEKVIKSRFITSCLRTDLQRIDKLYCRLARCSYELYKLRKEVDVEYISVCGVVTCKDEKTRTGFTEKEKDIELEIATLKKSVGDIVTRRTKLITSELLQWKNKRGRDYFTKQKERRHIRGGHVIVGELKLTLSCYLNLVKERDALVSNDLQVLIYEDRVKDEHLAYERERQRDTCTFSMSVSLCPCSLTVSKSQFGSLFALPLNGFLLARSLKFSCHFPIQPSYLGQLEGTMKLTVGRLSHCRHLKHQECVHWLGFYPRRLFRQLQIRGRCFLFRVSR